MTLKEKLSKCLPNYTLPEGEPFPEINSLTSLSGGSINESYRLVTSYGPFFLKLNNSGRFPGIFEKEARGLELLASAGAIRIPEVILFGACEEDSFLILEFIEEGNLRSLGFEELGRALARLHQNHGDHFGLDHDNYIGSLPQINSPEETWSEFFAINRIEPQLKMARENGFFKNKGAKFNRFLARLDERVPKERPSLIHGDLWRGNYLTGSNGKPVLIDPAVYYGHRETDIAMMHLFGGFPKETFDFYYETFPLEKGWKERIDLHNLYPLMVHVNLFGGGYVRQVENILEKFG